MVAMLWMPRLPTPMATRAPGFSAGANRRRRVVRAHGGDIDDFYDLSTGNYEAGGEIA